MKKWTRLILVLFLVPAFFVTPGQGDAADLKKEGTDMAAELQGKTFFIVERTRDKKAENEYYAYFKEGGVLAIKYTATHSKGGKWQADDKGILCITTIRHKSNKTSLNETRCGKLVKKSDSAYLWYDGKGEQRATLSLKGQGDRLP